MEYLKKNKVFIALISILSICIIFLIVQLSKSTNSNQEAPIPETPFNTKTDIDSFNVSLSQGLNLTFNWNINRGNDVIKKMEIFHEDNILKDVSDKAVYSIHLFESGIPTGNNEFTFKITLESGKTIEKSTYSYIDEVLGFQLTSNKEKDKIVYTASYYYEKQSAVNAPKVQIQYDQKVDMPLNYKTSNKVEEKENYVHMKAIYELDTSRVVEGTYQADMNFIFDEYNLSFPETVIVEI